MHQVSRKYAGRHVGMNDLGAVAKLRARRCRAAAFGCALMLLPAIARPAEALREPADPALTDPGAPGRVQLSSEELAAMSDAQRQNLGSRWLNLELRGFVSMEQVIRYGTGASAAVALLLSAAALLNMRRMRAQIEARRTAEDRLQISESRLRAAMEGSETGLWEWSPQTGEVYLDPVWFTMLGYTPDAMPHTFETFEALLHPDDREATLKTIAETVSKRRERFEAEFRLRGQDGDYRWIHSRGRLLETDSAGNPVRLIGVHSDVTSQRNMQEALRESEGKLLKAQEIAHMGHWEWEIRDDRISWSDEVYRIYGIDRDAPLTYDRVVQAVHPEDRQYHDEHTARWIENRGGPPFEYRIIRPDGDIRYISARGDVHCDESGEPVQFTGVVQDITERRRHEAERNELFNRLQRIAANFPGFIYQYRQRPDGSSHLEYISGDLESVYGVSSRGGGG